MPRGAATDTLVGAAEGQRGRRVRGTGGRLDEIGLGWVRSVDETEDRGPRSSLVAGIEIRIHRNRRVGGFRILVGVEGEVGEVLVAGGRNCGGGFQDADAFCGGR